MNDSANRRIAATLADAGGAVGWLLARAFLVTVEALRRAFWRCHPRVRSARLRIRALTPGRAAVHAGKVAVVVLYTDGPVPAFTMALLEALARRSFDTVVVSNGALDGEARARLLATCCRLLERRNTGRDFGGYKDGIAVARSTFADIARLIIANDSVYYLPHGLDALLERMEGPDEFIGVSEVFEHHYHVASFLMSFGRRVLADPVFDEFWRRYLPVDTRMWAILEGEGELTRRLLEAGHRPTVLYRAEDLLPRYAALDPAAAAASLALFPPAFRAELRRRAGGEPAAGADHSRRLAEAIVEGVRARNQMHSAGFAFVKFLGLPLFKRDIVYRELFTVEEAQRAMAEAGVQIDAGIAADLRRRSAPGPFHLLRRLMFEHGYV